MSQNGTADGNGLGGILADDPLGDLVDGDAVADSAPSGTADPIGNIFLSMSRWNRTWLAAASLALAFGLGVIIASQVVSHYALQVQQAERERLMLSRQATFGPALPRAQERGIGEITGLSPEASASGVLGSMQVGQELRYGEIVQLSEGFVRVRLESGSEIIVEGPAEFSLSGEKAVFVRAGRVSAEVGDGLILQSRLVTADCLDAKVEFVTEEDASTSVFAHRGVVAVFSTPHEGNASRVLGALREQEGLVAKTTEGGQISVFSGSFHRGLVSNWADVESRYTDYQKLVLSDHPLAYWTLAHVRRNRRVLDLSQNGFDGLPIGNWPIELPATESSGQGTSFNGESYIEPDQKPAVNALTGFTVEAWAQPIGGPGYRAIFSSRFVHDTEKPTRKCYGYTLYAGDIDSWEFWTGSGRNGDPWNVIESPEKIESGRWAYVVGTFTPGNDDNSECVRGASRLYVNGKLSLEEEHEVSLIDFEWPARIGAAEFVPKHLASWMFKGRLRDVALYGYPLEPERIKSHFNKGRTSQNEPISQQTQFDKVLLAASFKESQGQGRPQKKSCYSSAN